MPILPIDWLKTSEKAVMHCKHGLNAHKQHNPTSVLCSFGVKMHNPTSVQCSFGVLVVVHKSLLDWQNSSLLVLRHARCLHAGALR